MSSSIASIEGSGVARVKPRRGSMDWLVQNLANGQIECYRCGWSTDFNQRFAMMSINYVAKGMKVLVTEHRRCSQTERGADLRAMAEKKWAEKEKADEAIRNKV